MVVRYDNSIGRPGRMLGRLSGFAERRSLADRIIEYAPNHVAIGPGRAIAFTTAWSALRSNRSRAHFGRRT